MRSLAHTSQHEADRVPRFAAVPAAHLDFHGDLLRAADAPNKGFNDRRQGIHLPLQMIPARPLASSHLFSLSLVGVA